MKQHIFYLENIIVNNNPGGVMKEFLLSLVALLATASAFAATTYTFTGPAYTTATGAFNTTMHLTGSFTTATPLAPNLPPNMPFTNITGQVTSYSFLTG